MRIAKEGGRQGAVEGRGEETRVNKANNEEGRGATRRLGTTGKCPQLLVGG